MPKKAPLRWPAHWYVGNYDIGCIVPHCGFFTDTNNLGMQWTQLHDHCRHTGGAEHALLEIMLRQNKCALCHNVVMNGTKDWNTRALFNHEGLHHHSAEMFSIDSFVVLVREGRVDLIRRGGQMRDECQRLAFARMLEKVRARPLAELDLLFERSGVPPGQRTSGNLERILTYDRLAPRDNNAPYLPLPAQRFLWFCSPHGNDPADDNWRRVWRSLREKYADGRI